MTTKTKRWCGRGESFAESFAREHEDEIIARYDWQQRFPALRETLAWVQDLRKWFDIFNVKLDQQKQDRVVLAQQQLKVSFPAEFSAIKIIPCDKIPLISRGAKFTSKLTCCPIISSGL